MTNENQYSKVEMKLYECNVEEKFQKFLGDQTLTTENLSYLNQVAGALGSFDTSYSKELSKFIELTKISNLKELAVLSKNMEFLSFEKDIYSPREYAEMLLDDVVGIDYHFDSDDYIDYDGFGRGKMERFSLVFTETGLLSIAY